MPADSATEQAADRAVGTSARYAASAAFRNEPGGATTPPILLLHGLGGDSSQLWELPPSGVSRFAPDARAHGDTPFVGDDEDSVARSTQCLDANGQPQ